MVILESTQQNGEWFRPPTGGIVQVLLSGAQSGATYTLRVRKPGTTAAVASGAAWTDAGVLTVYLSRDLEYRMEGDSASAVGATAETFSVG